MYSFSVTFDAGATPNQGILKFTPTGGTAGLVCGKGFDPAAVKIYFHKSKECSPTIKAIDCFYINPFSSYLTNGPNKLLDYITLGLKGLLVSNTLGICNLQRK
jgi:hypothetical protein